MGEPNDERKYVGYLQTISLISFLTALIEIFLLFLHWHVGIKWHMLLAYTSVGVLIILGFLGLLVASDIDISEPINKFFRNRNKGRFVTILFFSHLICVSLFIVQDGGAQTSCISNILLLDAGFGYFFATKKLVKRMVSFLCVLSYLICFLFFFDSTKQVFVTNFTFDILPYLLTILFVLGVNTIINSQITNKSNKREKVES